MGIMLLGHPRVSVAQLARDNGQWRAAHDQSASIGMTQNVKTDRRNNAGSVACIPHKSNLVAAAPGSPILSDKNQIGAALVCHGSRKKLLPFVRQENMPRFSGFRARSVYGCRHRVEITDPHFSQLTVACPAQQGGGNQLRERGVASDNERLRL